MTFSPRAAKVRAPLALTLLLALIVALLAAGTTAALAATKHLGYQGGSSTGAGWLGDIETAPGSGLFAYCVDPYGLFPDGNTGFDSLVTKIPGTTAAANPDHNGTQTVSGDDMARLNYALFTFGEATTDVEAAAMDAYVYSLSSSDHPGSGVDFFIDIRVDAKERDAVRERFRLIRDTTEAHWNEAAQLDARLAFTTTDVRAYEGFIDVAITPASARGVLTLSNATQQGTGAREIPVGNGDRVAVTGVPVPDHGFTMRADLEASGPYDYSSNLRLYTTPVNDQFQRVVRHGERSLPTVKATATSEPLSVEFTPVVSTAVASRVVKPGDAFVDATTAFAATGTWFRDASIVGDYTVYGPFADEPPTASDVPAGAPVAATGSTVFAGPGSSSTSSTTLADRSGWYTWVWSIEAAHQDEPTRGVLPDGYRWHSIFGEGAESSVVPIAVAISTDVTQKTVGLYTAVSDRVTVAHDDASGAWFTRGGAPIVVTLDGTAYWVPGDAPPVESPTAPDDAAAIGSVSITASGPGAYESPALTAPQSANGYVVWQWRVREGDDVRAHVEAWGATSQTTRVLAPIVSTTAGTGGAPGRPVTDVAHVAGPALGQPAGLVFEAFRQAGSAPTCTDDTRIFSTKDTPVSITGPGDYPSLPATFDRLGTYLWIATLTAHDGTVIARGDCGAPGETTMTVPFTVTTSASPTALPGEPATDIATVTGPTPPGASIVFRAHRLADAAAPVCDAANVVYTSAAVAIDAPGDYRSESTTFPSVGTYAWVETAYDSAGIALVTGACGERTELTVVSAGPSTVAPTPAPTPTVVSAPTVAPTVTPGATPAPSVSAVPPAPAVKAVTAPKQPGGLPAKLASTGLRLNLALVAAFAASVVLLSVAVLALARTQLPSTGRRARR